jgi:hypothetical protein
MQTLVAAILADRPAEAWDVGEQQRRSQRIEYWREWMTLWRCGRRRIIGGLVGEIEHAKPRRGRRVDDAAESCLLESFG